MPKLEFLGGVLHRSLKLQIKTKAKKALHKPLADLSAVRYDPTDHYDSRTLDAHGRSSLPPCSSQPRISGRTSFGEPQPQVSFARLTVNMVLCGLGAGILSLPWTTAGAGILNAGFWNAAVLGLSYFTMMMMVRAAERHGCFDMEALLQKCDWLGVSGGKWRVGSRFVVLSRPAALCGRETVACLARGFNV